MTTVVVERERNMVTALDGVRSYVQPSETAQLATRAARRRWVTRLSAIGVVALTGAFGILALSRRSVPVTHPPLYTGVWTLSCLSNDAAADLLRAQGLQSRWSTVESRVGSRMLTVRASAEELELVRTALATYDNPGKSTCLVIPVTLRAP
ncbi:MAG: hypothetical protein ABIY52_08255 [Gemmatimonadaceae bacterium]